MCGPLCDEQCIHGMGIDSYQGKCEGLTCNVGSEVCATSSMTTVLCICTEHSFTQVTMYCQDCDACSLPFGSQITRSCPTLYRSMCMQELHTCNGIIKACKDLEGAAERPYYQPKFRYCSGTKIESGVGRCSRFTALWSGKLDESIAIGSWPVDECWFLIICIWRCFSAAGIAGSTRSMPKNSPRIFVYYGHSVGSLAVHACSLWPASSG